MYYPVHIRVQDELCLVVGGGDVAWRKAKGLCDSGARVLLIAPKVDPRIRKLDLNIRRKKFAVGDLKGATLVISATNDREVNEAVSRACRRRRIPVNVVDQPDLCTFIVPAVVRRGPVRISVSTNGTSPGLASTMRKDLQRIYPAGLARVARIIGSERIKLMKKHPPGAARMKRLARLSSERILGRVKRGRYDEAVRLVREAAR